MYRHHFISSFLPSEKEQALVPQLPEEHYVCINSQHPEERVHRTPQVCTETLSPLHYYKCQFHILMPTYITPAFFRLNSFPSFPHLSEILFPCKWGKEKMKSIWTLIPCGKVPQTISLYTIKILLILYLSKKVILLPKRSYSFTKVSSHLHLYILNITQREII